MRKLRAVAPLAVAVLLPAAMLSACSSDSDEETSTDTSAAAAAAGGLTVEDPWCRSNPPMAGVTACYGVIVNDGDTDDALVAVTVSADVAGEAQVHETVAAEEGMTDDTMGESMSDESMADGSMGEEMTDESMADGAMGEEMTDDTMGGHSGGMTMREVASIEVPAGGEATLEPGGYHIMLLELVEPLEEGGTVQLTLEFESGEMLEVDAEVRAA